MARRRARRGHRHSHTLSTPTCLRLPSWRSSPHRRWSLPGCQGPSHALPQDSHSLVASELRYKQWDDCARTRARGRGFRERQQGRHRQPRACSRREPRPRR